MHLQNYKKRSDIRSVEGFLRCGSESIGDFDENKASERITQCENKIADILALNIRDSEKHDDIMSEIFSQIDIFEELAFELGLLTGAKLTFQAIDRLENIY